MHVINSIIFDFYDLWPKILTGCIISVTGKTCTFVAIQLDKFCCMFDYNFKNNPPYKKWQEKKRKYPPGYWLKTNSILTEISYYPVPHLILHETCPLRSIFLFRDKQLKQI
jgi:hypothetical protein